MLSRMATRSRTAAPSVRTRSRVLANGWVRSVLAIAYRRSHSLRASHSRSARHELRGRTCLPACPHAQPRSGVAGEAKAEVAGRCIGRIGAAGGDAVRTLLPSCEVTGDGLAAGADVEHRQRPEHVAA